MARRRNPGAGRGRRGDGRTLAPPSPAPRQLRPPRPVVSCHFRAPHRVGEGRGGGDAGGTRPLAGDQWCCKCIVNSPTGQLPRLTVLAAASRGSVRACGICTGEVWQWRSLQRALTKRIPVSSAVSFACVEEGRGTRCPSTAPEFVHLGHVLGRPATGPLRTGQLSQCSSSLHTACDGTTQSTLVTKGQPQWDAERELTPVEYCLQPRAQKSVHSMPGPGRRRTALAARRGATRRLHFGQRLRRIGPVAARGAGTTSVQAATQHANGPAPTSGHPVGEPGASAGDGRGEAGWAADPGDPSPDPTATHGSPPATAWRLPTVPGCLRRTSAAPSLTG